MRRTLLLAVLAALLSAPAAQAWSWPTDGAVLQPFLFDPAHPYAAGQHRGIDVGGEQGTPVRTAAAGTVTFAGSVPGSGKCVAIAVAGGLSVTLTHLGTIAVSEGAVVAEGAAVGTIGPSGDAEVGDPYVHLGIRVASEAQGYVDPLLYLPPRAAPPAPAPSEPAPAPTPGTDSPATVAPPAPAPAAAA